MCGMTKMMCGLVAAVGLIAGSAGLMHMAGGKNCPFSSGGCKPCGMSPSGSECSPGTEGEASPGEIAGRPAKGGKGGCGECAKPCEGCCEEAPVLVVGGIFGEPAPSKAKFKVEAVPVAPPANE